MGGTRLTKALIQLSVDGQGCVPSLLFGLRPNYGRGNDCNGHLLQKDLCMHGITFLTKVCIVKCMVFPVVMYGCESWTIKKAEPKELMLSNCGAEEDS